MPCSSDSPCARHAGHVQALHCPDAFAAEVQQLLQRIHPLLSDDAPAVVDNACGAAARVLQAHAARLPVPQVLQVLLQHLPIRKDWEEVHPVAEALRQLVQGEHAQSVVEQHSDVCSALLACALEQRASAEARQVAASGIKTLLDADDRLATLLHGLSAEQQQTVHNLMNAKPA